MSDFYHKPSAIEQNDSNGYSPAVQEFVNFAQENGLDLLYAQLRINNRIKDNYLTHPLRTRLNVFELSEGVVGIAAGIAIEEKLISLNDRVVDYFSEYVTDDMDVRMGKVTLYHLLTMTTGMSGEIFICDDPARYDEKDWLAAFFRGEFSDEPGERFSHCCLNTYVISRMIEKKAGLNLLEYLRDRMFEPIGIGNPDWLPCPKGHIMGFNGLYLTDQEMGNLGALILSKGSLNYHNVVSEEYVNKMCSPITDAGNGLKYGMHMWIIPDLNDTLLLKGRFGQGVVIAKDKGAVLSFQALEGYKYDALWRKAAEVLRMI